MMILPPIRVDKWGDGSFGASRSKGQKKYTHKGIDYAAYAGSIVLSPVSGVISRLGYCYAVSGPRSEYRLIEIASDGVLVRLLYLAPLVRAGQQISAGDKLGTVQDLSKLYPDIKSHCHVDVRRNGSFIDPESYLQNQST